MPNCSSRSPDHFDILIHGSTKIVDARAIIVGAVDPHDFSRYLALEATKSNLNIFS